MDVEQAICTMAIRNKPNKRKSLTQSKKKSPAAIRKEIELQIMDRGDVSIEKVTEQFLAEGSEIENRDGPYTADDYIPTPKNISADFLHSFDKNEHYNYNEKEEEEKKSLKTNMISRQRRKMDKIKGNEQRTSILESYIKQGKSPSEIYKSNLMNLSRSTIFERCKRYKEDISFERKSGSGRKSKYIDEHIQYILNLINTDPSITSTQIKEKLFENFEDIKISVGTIYKILKDNDFQWIAPSIIPKNGPEQQKLRMNWCKRHKDRN